MKAKTDLGKEVLDIVKDTKEYLLFLKETGVAEAFTEEPSMSQGLTKGHENPVCHPEPKGKGLMAREKQILRCAQNDSKVAGVFSDEPSMNQGLTRDAVDRRGLTPSDKSRRLEELRQKIGECKRCKLWNGRTHIVFGTGNPDTRLLFVGEGPGEEEDRQGKPFVGRAGELLTKMIGAMGLVRDDVYIANVIKCRPPQNRNPEEDEITACRPFLEEQIEIIRPEVICALGTFAAHTLLKTEVKISGLRGKIHVKDNYKIVPTFHPAYLLRNAGQKHLAWEDLQIIMKELGFDRRFSHETTLGALAAPIYPGRKS